MYTYPLFIILKNTIFMQKLVLIDGNTVIHRMYHALPYMENSQGKPTNAIYGFTNILLTILEIEHPEYIAIAFDHKGKSFRHEMDEAYKATREKMDDTLACQLPYIHRIADAFNIPKFIIPGYEADDTLVTLARKHASPDLQAIIVSEDMDLLQAVNKHIVLHTLKKGYRQSQIMDSEAVQKKYGIQPEQIPDLKGLQGDNSDNIPGVPGIGPKTAVKLLQSYQSLQGVYEHIDEIQGSTKTKLSEHKEIAFKSKELATIYDAVQNDMKLQKCETHDVDMQSVQSYFEELEFTSLLPRAQKWQKHFIQSQNHKQSVEAMLSQDSLF